jgi:hypothetical protein
VLGKLFLGNGTLRPELRRALEAEGLVRIDENLSGSIRYEHFKAPGKRFHGKVTPERIAFGMSEERVVAYCRSGRAKLVDTPYTSPRFAMVTISAEDGRLEFLVDYDKGDEPEFAGRVKIRMEHPEAAAVAADLNARIGR